MTESRVQTGLERLRKDFQKGDRLEAKVTLDKLDYHPATNTATPYLTIDSGPIVEVRTTGTKVSGSRLRELVPVYQERTVDRSLLVEGQQNLAEYFRSKGYFDAQVDFMQLDPEPNRTLIEYNITSGDRHKLKHIEITGNRYFDYATLRERMYLQTASLLRRRYGLYSERLLQQDEDNIADLYKANGFPDVMVMHPPVRDNYGGEHGNLAVEIQINEGPQWLVNQMTIEGVPAEDEAYLRSIVRSTEGQPYSAANIAADRDAVLGYYYNNGYPDAQFESSQDPAAAPNQVNLRYKVTPGEQQFVRGALVRGLETTKPSLVKSRILVAPGDPISQSRIAQSQQRVVRLGDLLQGGDGAPESGGQGRKQVRLVPSGRSPQVLVQLRRRRGARAHRGRRQLARLPGRNHGLQPARFGRRQPDKRSGTGPHGELANPGFDIAEASAGKLRRAAVRGA